MSVNIIPSIKVMKDKKMYTEIIRSFNKANINTLRCNISTLSADEYINCIKSVKKIWKSPFKLIIDVPIPKDKTRVEFKKELKQIEVHTGDKICISKVKHEDKCFSVNHILYVDSEFTHIKTGDILIVGDGIIEIEVDEKNENYLLCHSLNNGYIDFRKSIATKYGFIKVSSNEKFEKAIKIIEELRPEYVALSYVECKEDINLIVSQIKSHEPKIISKVENLKGINNIVEIINNSESIMIPRGCLTLNAGITNLLYYQDFIQDKCKEYKIDSYIAAGILSSLGKSYNPSRADVCDLGYIIKSGIKNIILSGSTCNVQNFDRAVKCINELSKVYKI